MSDLYEKYLTEATYAGAYPNDGVGGVATDDDLPPGTYVFGDKYVPVEEPNRISGTLKKYIPAEDLGQEWNYDEFEHSQSMGSGESYSDTLKSLQDVVGDRMWKHVDLNKSADLEDSKEDARDNTEIDQDNKLGDDEEESLKVEESSLLGKIDKWTFGDRIDEAVLAGNDRKTLTKIIMSGKSSKVKIKSLGLEATVRNDDEEVHVIYPKNDDFTMSLVEIADAMGLSFTTGKNAKNLEFTFYMD